MNRLVLLFLCFSFGLTAQQEFTETMETADGTRSYIVQLPSAYDGITKLPVVFVFHGLGDNAQNMTGTGFGILGEQENFIAVYPQGLEIPFLGNGWNNGTPVSATGFNADDMGFVNSMIDVMIADYSADETRIYSCGFSMGGIMSHRIGCEMSDRVAAIASQAGVMAVAIENTCAPEYEVPVLHIHGDADGTVPYDGNAQFGLTSVSQTIEKWKSVNGCPETATTTSLPDTQDDGYTITEDAYACSAESEVKLWTVHNAEHVWLGPNNDVTTTVEFWNFFKQFTRETSTPISNIEEILFSISPNPVRDVLRIEGLGEGMNISITDVLGRTISDFEFSSNEIDVNHLSKGIYFIHVSGSKSNRASSQKFIKS